MDHYDRRLVVRMECSELQQLIKKLFKPLLVDSFVYFLQFLGTAPDI